VCYSVLHVKSHKLPNLECKTCHNQFHSECLHEWFKSSGKSACVICQQPWSGIRIN
jgi:E3 ubiquitin-protein ligase DOA10